MRLVHIVILLAAGFAWLLRKKPRAQTRDVAVWYLMLLVLGVMILSILAEMSGHQP